MGSTSRFGRKREGCAVPADRWLRGRDRPGLSGAPHRRRDRPLVVPAYPEDTDVHNKPIGLNAAVRRLDELGIDYEWIGIADAEDLFHPSLLRMVDYRFRRSGAGIVQCGVQLMNFSAHPSTQPLPAGRLPRLRRWLRSNASGWRSAALSNAGHAVYLDAGHASWRSTGEMASRLLRSGIAHAEGFAVNVASRQTTIESYRWGLELSDLVGNRDLVIDTSRNGVGPPRDNQWSNPPRQALGPEPQTTRRAYLAALLWIKAPDESDGKCGGENTFLFSPRQAGNLIAQTPPLSAPARQAAQIGQPN